MLHCQRQPLSNHPAPVFQHYACSKATDIAQLGEEAINVDHAEVLPEWTRTLSALSVLIIEKLAYQEFLNISLAVSLPWREVTSSSQAAENVLSMLLHTTFNVLLFKAQVESLQYCKNKAKAIVKKKIE